MTNLNREIMVIGAGLAGSECVYQLAKRGISVTWVEMRPKQMTPAHQTEKPAEMVCSNSFRSNDVLNAVGLLKEEMASLDSLVMRAAYHARVPAGTALAVDRDAFSDFIEKDLQRFENIEKVADEVVNLEKQGDEWLIQFQDLPAKTCERVVLATGPLTSPALSKWIATQTGQEHLYFYDSIAPIIEKESIDFSKVFSASRYGSGTIDDGDYLNCPLTQEQYENLIQEIQNAELAEVHDFDKAQFFEGCLPIEEMASRGVETLRYGPMKPVGIENPHNPDEKPWAVVQLRQDNLHATLFNMVGFQTRMKWGEQKRIFRMIPGLENAEFVRMGAMHRNTYICSPKLLQGFMELKSQPGIHFAGQITGCEGYVESAAIGLYVGLGLSAQKDLAVPPNTTALGALVNHILKADPNDYQPMNINFGLFEPIEVRAKKFDRKVHMVKRAFQDYRAWYYENI